MKTDTRKIKIINTICIILLTIICVVYMAIEAATRQVSLVEHYFLFAVIVAVAVIINANRRTNIAWASRITVVSLIMVGNIVCWTVDSPVFMIAMIFVSAGLAFYNGVVKAYVEQFILSFLSVALYVVYPYIAEKMNVSMDADYKRIYIIEAIIILVVLMFFNILFMSMLIAVNKKRNLVNEQDYTMQELLKIIEAKADEARNATKSKSEFLASMSHEIRTPINSVLGMNEMILRETKEEFTREYANDIQNSGNVLLGLINNILDFSKIETGKMQIIPVVYDLSAVLNDLILMVSGKAASKSISIKLVVDPTVPRILKGDEVRIKQIVTNILSNAVKYTDEGSITVLLDYKKRDEHTIMLRVQITDTGRGMKQEDFDKLFAPFERIEELRNRHVEGTGLGMSITRQLLDLMNSKLEVKSVYGEGSTFGFTIRQEVVKWDELGDYEEAFKRLRNSKNKENHEKFIAPNAKVLVVDDLQLNINVFVNLLKRTQVQVDTALSGAEAFQKAREKNYDIIFMDHMMPEMDGVETLTKIRKDRFSLCRMTQVIALTANAVSGAREFYIEKGFADYLSKPVNPARLEAMVENYLPDELVMPLTSEAEISGKTQDESFTVETVEAPFRKIPQLNVDDGISYTGDAENYVQMVEEFYNTIESRAKIIQEYWENKDIKNYIIQVHALKSTARLIGAMELSELAKSLEEAGNKGDIEHVNAYTGELLDQYYELRESLSTVIKAKNTDSLPLISEEELSSCIKDISEGFENFDFEKMENTVKKMEEYKMPEDFAEKFEKLRNLVSDVAIEEIGQWLESV